MTSSSMTLGFDRDILFAQEALLLAFLAHESMAIHWFYHKDLSEAGGDGPGLWIWVVLSYLKASCGSSYVLALK